MQVTVVSGSTRRESIVSRMHRNAQRLYIFLLEITKYEQGVKRLQWSALSGPTHTSHSKSFGDLLASLVPVNLFGQRHSVNGDISLRRQRKPFLDALASLAFKLSLKGSTFEHFFYFMK